MNRSYRETKSLGCPIEVDLYWAFREVAAKRKETIGQAVENALHLYIAAIETSNGNKETVTPHGEDDKIVEVFERR